MAAYTLMADPSCVRRDDGAVVPVDAPGNTDSDAYRAWVAAGNTAAPAPARPGLYLTGQDLVDGMSPAQAKAANDVDPRNLLRIQTAPRASMVKSKIARVEKDAGLAAGTLVSQATPTGGA